MKKALLLPLYLMFALVMSAQGYRNPVIPGYHPDPSVVRVGDDFYLVNSSFQYFPGVPVYHSRDLVNWLQIGNVLDRESQVDLKDFSSWLGIYAPTIRYNDGTYYMITTNVGAGGNFMVTSDNPTGPWSEPIWLKQQGIDPSLYFENGKCYMVSNPDNTIMLCEIDPKTGRQLTESKAIWRGTGGRYPEGPHIYNKDGWYYLLISEGGTELAHKLTMARSRNIYGPYESNPDNPILTHCSMAGQSNQIQGTGHGDFVQAKDGSWWIVFLAYRNYGGSYHHLGRETYLAPVVWEKDKFPVVNDGKPVDTLMNVRTLPLKPIDIDPNPTAKGFDKLGFEWVYIQNPDSSKYALTDGKLRLYGSASTLTENKKPTFIGRRQEHAVLNLTSDIDASGLKPDDEAGLTVYQINNGHYDLYVRRSENGALQAVLAYQIKSLHKEEAVITLDSDVARLQITSDGTMYTFHAGTSSGMKTLGAFDTSLVSTEVVGGFTGVVLGMFAHGNGHADFMNFDYRGQ
ncbi:MAG: glycoside hydrolase family 43 protein [Prevotellaceae bacterium]|nr:glycoside hydrolase family 43 protein [Prevotellaceae bacterium]